MRSVPFGDLMVKGEHADFGFWESFTRSPLYLSQLRPLQAWIQGDVLDVASNYGRFSALAETTVSVDLETRFLQRGRELGNIRRPVTASALALPFRDRSFDTVLAMGIIDHIPYAEIPLFLDGLARVALGDGSIIIQITSPYCFFALRHFRAYHDYVHAYSPLRLRKQMLQRGWHACGVFSSGLVGSFSVLPRTVNALVPWAPHVTMRFRRNPG